jgi:uncharacterized protein (TIGR02145 family)
LGTVGIEQIDANAGNSMRIYPNPMTNTGNIEFEMPTAGRVTIDLYDITGKKVSSTQNNLQAGTQSFNVTGLNRGIYTVSIKSDKFSYSGKIISLCSSPEKANISFLNSIPKSDPKKNLKSTKSLVSMQYTAGDRLLIKAISGNYATDSTLVPVKDSTVTSNFIDCTDGDGNHYATVTIGTQVWTVENMKTTKYNDGSDIALVTDNTAWTTAGAAYCWYNNDIANKVIYGALYNWFAVDAASNGGKNIAPTGWHVPSDAEYTTLTTYLGGETVAGGKMKESGTTHWTSPNTSATNESGFTALPGGYRDSGDGTFYSVGGYGYYWSSSAIDATYAWLRYLYYSDATAYSFYGSKANGFSVRCVRD